MKRSSNKSPADLPIANPNSPSTAQIQRPSLSKSTSGPHSRPSITSTRRHVSIEATSDPPSPMQSSSASTQRQSSIVAGGKSKLSRENGSPTSSSAPLPNMSRRGSRQEGARVDESRSQMPPHQLLKRKSTSGDSDTTLRQTISPTLEDTFASPVETALRPALTHSTESTDSTQTVRGPDTMRLMGDPAQRTPSYPFPYVPSRSSSSRQAPLHQPFMALSPSSPGTTLRGQARTRERFREFDSPMKIPTVAATAATPGTDRDDRFPTPDLYNLILHLNSEPDLESWWARLITIMREEYRVHRLSLAVPVDATDIENVPWGQKASYNATGLRLAFSSADPSSADSVTSFSSIAESVDRAPPSMTNPWVASQRPTLETRHSYAGFEARRGSLGEDRHLEKPRRPLLSRFMTSDAPVLSNFTARPEPMTPSLPPPTPVDEREPSTVDSSRPESSDPRSICHKTLYALNREDDPLIDAAGVNRVIERGSTILLTREFKDDAQTSRRDSRSGFFSAPRRDETLRPMKPSVSDYEDYEQQPATPWSESPAPSPALRDDPEDNPFFSPGEISETSFEPSPAEEPDYSKSFEAIGVDNSSTLIHLPLIHPTLSKLMSNRDEDSSTPQPDRPPFAQPQPIVADRKAPIGILSIMSDAVPYPRNWYESLDQLKPHLSTSFHTCYQNSMISDRLEKALERQAEDMQGGGFNAKDGAPFALGLGLDTLLQYDANDDTFSSTVGTVTSPSEGQSTRSNASIAGSPLGTPARETSSDSPHSYFDTRKRQSLERTRSGGVILQTQIGAMTSGRSSGSDHRSALRSLEGPAPKKDEKMSRRARDGATSRNAKNEPAEAKQAQASNSKQTAVSASILHSKGADFKASFPSLPPAATRGLGRARQQRPSYSPSMSNDPAIIGISDSLIRILIDTIPVQVFILDPATCRISWVNSKYLAYGGLSPYEVYSSEPWETVHRDEAKDLEQAWWRAIHTGQQLQHKARMRRFDGHYRYQYIRGAPLRTADQRIVHWVGVITDFHDQHVAELNASRQHETAQSEAKYRALANSSPQIVFAVTKSKGVTFCNEQWPAFSGQNEEQARGMGFMEAVHPDDLVKCKLPSFDEDNFQASNVPISLPAEPRRSKSSATSSTLSESSAASGETVLATTNLASPATLHMPQRKLSELASKGILKASKDATGKQSYTTEVRLRMSTGEYRWHLVRVLLAEPLIQADHAEETWYGTCTDINDHKVLEQTLKETMDAKSRFLSNMSHEIRTPLNGIMGMTNFLIDSHLSADQADHVNVIRASTEGLRDLINDILDLSKVEAGMIKLNMDWLHIRSVIEDVNDLTSPLALEKGIEVNFLVDTDVELMLKGDRFRFRQVLLNVIGNAIKFTQDGEVYVHCHKLPTLPEDIKDHSSLVQVDVMDTGSGFSEKEADMLFKRFSQIDGSSTRQHGGTGLGLVISMQLVELHGGHMMATSTVGKGSCFSFTLRFGTPWEEDRPSQDYPLHQVPQKIEPEEARIIGKLAHRARTDSKSSQDQPSTQALFGGDIAESPAFLPRIDRTSPMSAGSDHSIRTAATATSRMSSRSSQSSVGSTDLRALKVEMGSQAGRFRSPLSSPPVVAPQIVAVPRLYSILVVSPLQWTRQAIMGHLDSILNHQVPHNITAREDISEAEQLLGGSEPVKFTHIVLIMKDTDDVMDLIQQSFKHQSQSTIVVVCCDIDQRKVVVERSRHEDLLVHLESHRLQFVQKPLKPSKLANIFDPEKARESSVDVNKSSHQQVAAHQKQVFDNMASRLGDRGLRVLLVEDNKINQMVMLRLLQRISVTVDTAMDGVQATDKVLNSQPGYYSIVLMDLMMPNKDGYQSCKDIRKWEDQNTLRPIPIVALSANVLDDVWRKCKDAGFNDYLTKPLQFEELSQVMTNILDPEDPNKPLEFMRSQGGPQARGRV